jgi:hypothetical protein
MPNTGKHYTDSEIAELIHDYENRRPDMTKRGLAAKWGMEHGFSPDGVRAQIDRLILLGKIDMGRIPESPYPIYDEPLLMEGDAVILPDLEAPFHHAEFVNRVLDLAEAWGIRQAILPGDAIHLDSFSGWQPNWKKEQTGGVTEKAESKLVEFAKTLPKKKQGELFDLLGGIEKVDVEDGASTELAEAGKVLRRLADQFDAIDWSCGNHEGRLLRTMETALSPTMLLDLVAIPDTQRPRWRVAPFYFSYLRSSKELFQVEHPKNTAKYSAWKLAGKYLCHVIMTHSHQLNFTFDASGQFYAIEAGCCCDETRFAYVAQRHNTAAQHALGAVIVRDGIPWLLHARSPFDKLRMT